MSKEIDSCVRYFMNPLKDRLIIDGPKGQEDQKDTQGKSKVTESVDNKGLLRRIGSTLLLVPKTDQEIRTKTHRLPTKKEL